MGLTAFALFVVPWMLLAVWLFTLPSAIRLGAPSAPWRPLAAGREQLEDQQRREAIRERQLRESDSRNMLRGGALGSGTEETEPKE
jgi:hypothetical protein